MRIELVGRYSLAFVERVGAAVVGFLAGSAAAFSGLERPYQLALLLLAMVALDTVTGMLAAAKEGRQIKSSVLRRIAEKLLAYFAVTLVTVVALYALGSPPVWIATAASGVVGALLAVEGLSVLENVVRLRIKRLGPVLKAVSRLLRLPIERWEEVARDGSELEDGAMQK